MKKLIKKTFKTVVICLLGIFIFAGTSYLLLNSCSTAYATIYWNGGSATDSFFVPKFYKLGMKAIFGGPVTLNGSGGHFVVLQANQTVPELLYQLEEQFSELPPGNVSTGKGTNGAFFTARADDRICATMLIRDYNINKTLVFIIMAPAELFRHPEDPFADENGTDPVAELRPPGSKRVFCFETPAIAFTAYKSIDGDLTDFYESAFSAGDIRAVSITTFSDKKLPNNGNLFFFDSHFHKGFVVYQSSPEENCSYSIVCAQAQ